MLRFVFWLLAAFSLGEAVPAAAEPSRIARSGSFSAEPLSGDAATDRSIPAQILVSAENPVLPPAIVGAEPALDGEDGKTAAMLSSRGRTSAAAGIVAAQLPDGQPSTAFNSRAPPIA